MEKVLTPDQENAEKLIKEWFFNTDNLVFVLAGYAGTGKTFLIDRIVRESLHLKAGTEAVFVTPTGKAATVLIKNGTVAGTVHSLIYTRNEDDLDVDENGEIVERETLSFTKKEKIDEKIRLIIVDEASMIGEDVLRYLLSFGGRRRIIPLSVWRPSLGRARRSPTEITTTRCAWWGGISFRRRNASAFF